MSPSDLPLDRPTGWRRWVRRRLWEPVAMLIIGAGVVMLTQPVSFWLYGHSFTVILIGTAAYVVASHLPDA